MLGQQPVLVSAAMDGTIRLWDVVSQRQLHAIPYAESQVNALCITPGQFRTVSNLYESSLDGTQLATAAWQNLRMYSLKEPTTHGLHTFGVHEKNVTTVGFQTDGRWMYTGGEDCMAKIWDMRVNQLNCQRIFQVNSTVHSVALHPNQNELVVADSAGALYVWDLRNDKDDSLVTELDLNEFVNHVDIDSSGRQCAAVTNRGHLLLWSLPHSGGIMPSIATPPPIGTPRAPGQHPLALSPQSAGIGRAVDRDEIDRTIHETERELGMVSGQMMGPEFPPLSPAPPPVQDATPPTPPPAPQPTGTAPQTQQPVSPLPTTTIGCNGRPCAKLRAHNTFALKCRFRPDGLAVATSSADQTTKLWSMTNHKMVGSYGVANNKWVWDCAFTNDSSHMVTASSDGVMRMWELASNRVVRTYQGHSMAITAMAFRDYV